MLARDACRTPSASTTRTYMMCYILCSCVCQGLVSLMLTEKNSRAIDSENSSLLQLNKQVNVALFHCEVFCLEWSGGIPGESQCCGEENRFISKQRVCGESEFGWWLESRLFRQVVEKYQVKDVRGESHYGGDLPNRAGRNARDSFLCFLANTRY